MRQHGAFFPKRCISDRLMPKGVSVAEVREVPCPSPYHIHSLTNVSPQVTEACLAYCKAAQNARRWHPQSITPHPRAASSPSGAIWAVVHSVPVGLSSNLLTASPALASASHFPIDVLWGHLPSILTLAPWPSSAASRRTRPETAAPGMCVHGHLHSSASALPADGSME